MVTYVVLSILAKNNLWSKEIHEAISSVTSSKISLDEKSLHRTLRRLEKYGLISHKKIDGQKTGAKRRVYFIAHAGEKFINIINDKYKF